MLSALALLLLCVRASSASPGAELSAVLSRHSRAHALSFDGLASALARGGHSTVFAQAADDGDGAAIADAVVEGAAFAGEVGARAEPAGGGGGGGGWLARAHAAVAAAWRRTPPASTPAAAAGPASALSSVAALARAGHMPAAVLLAESALFGSGGSSDADWASPALELRLDAGAAAAASASARGRCLARLLGAQSASATRGCARLRMVRPADAALALALAACFAQADLAVYARAAGAVAAARAALAGGEGVQAAARALGARLVDAGGDGGARAALGALAGQWLWQAESRTARGGEGGDDGGAVASLPHALLLEAQLAGEEAAAVSAAVAVDARGGASLAPAPDAPPRPTPTARWMPPHASSLQWLDDSFQPVVDLPAVVRVDGGQPLPEVRLRQHRPGGSSPRSFSWGDERFGADDAMYDDDDDNGDDDVFETVHEYVGVGLGLALRADLDVPALQRLRHAYEHAAMLLVLLHTSRVRVSEAAVLRAANGACDGGADEDGGGAEGGQDADEHALSTSAAAVSAGGALASALADLLQRGRRGGGRAAAQLPHARTVRLFANDTEAWAVAVELAHRRQPLAQLFVGQRLAQWLDVGLDVRPDFGGGGGGSGGGDDDGGARCAAAIEHIFPLAEAAVNDGFVASATDPIGTVPSLLDVFEDDTDAVSSAEDVLNIDFIKHLALEGDAHAQAQYGDMLIYGDERGGLPADPVAAERFLLAAANAGDAQARAQLGMLQIDRLLPELAAAQQRGGGGMQPPPPAAQAPARAAAAPAADAAAPPPAAGMAGVGGLPGGAPAVGLVAAAAAAAGGGTAGLPPAPGVVPPAAAAAAADGGGMAAIAANISIAHEHLLAALAAGSDQAHSGLGYLYMIGAPAAGIPRNLSLAAEHLRLAAAAGHATAHSNVAAIYLMPPRGDISGATTDGVAYNASGARWHLKEALKSSGEFLPAMFNLGLLEFHGLDRDGGVGDGGGATTGNCSAALALWSAVAQRGRWLHASAFAFQSGLASFRAAMAARSRLLPALMPARRRGAVRDPLHAALLQHLALAALGLPKAQGAAAFLLRSRLWRPAEAAALLDVPRVLTAPLNGSAAAAAVTGGAGSWAAAAAAAGSSPLPALLSFLGGGGGGLLQGGSDDAKAAQHHQPPPHVEDPAPPAAAGGLARNASNALAFQLALQGATLSAPLGALLVGDCLFSRWDGVPECAGAAPAPAPRAPPLVIRADGGQPPAAGAAAIAAAAAAAEAAHPALPWWGRAADQGLAHALVSLAEAHAGLGAAAAAAALPRNETLAWLLLSRVAALDYLGAWPVFFTRARLLASWLLRAAAAGERAHFLADVAGCALSWPPPLSAEHRRRRQRLAGTDHEAGDDDDDDDDDELDKDGGRRGKDAGDDDGDEDGRTDEPEPTFLVGPWPLDHEARTMCTVAARATLWSVAAAAAAIAVVVAAASAVTTLPHRRCCC